MKTEMLQGLSLANGVSIFNLPDFDIDASWLDLGEVFGKVLIGIGEFISGIFDGI